MIDDSSVWVDPTRVSLRQLDRQLQRGERSLYNCVNSILEDAAFVQEVRQLYPSLPMLANLRCGRWYVRRPDGSCYFKSTDGHNNNWSFSTTRLNLHVVDVAAAHHGTIIVDSTKKGKLAPDAFSKTVPIWCCVINRAVAAWRKGLASTPQAQGSTETNGDALQWDTSLHLPLWISSVERCSIEALLDGFVEKLLNVGVDMAALSAALHKPLRPLWISPSTRILINRVPHPTEFVFIPLILLSASVPLVASLQQQPLWRHARLLSDSETSENGDAERETLTYCYIPGGGDDEETWAEGLTPELLWAHHRELVGAGAQQISSQVARLVANVRSSGSGSKGDSGLDSEACSVGATDGGSCNAERIRNGNTTRQSHVDMHHPLPHGCNQTAPFASTTLALGMSGDRPWPIGDSGILLGNHTSGEPPGVWSVVDAVLNCGGVEHSHMPGPTEDVDEHRQRYCWLAVRSSKRDRLSLMTQLPRALKFLQWHVPQGHRVLIHCDNGFDTCVAVAVAALLSSRSRDEQRDPQRFQNICNRLETKEDMGLTKDDVRKQLAHVCRFYPIAQPTRGMLKQVFNYFQVQRGCTHKST